MTTATDDQPFAPVADTPTLDIERFVDVLRRLDVLEPVDVALGIAGAGVPVLPVVPGSKAPMLERSHVSGCAACRRHELVAAKDHGATRDTDTIRAWFAAHPDAGVGMKDHPRLVRGDADFATGRDLIDARKRIGYGQPDGIADPLTAFTPGGQYRRRFLHLLPDGVPAPGGGTPVLGVSWYGSSGYVVVKGRHPNGSQYQPFRGDAITPLPPLVIANLMRRGSSNGDAVDGATSGEVTRFLTAHTGTAQLDLLARRRRKLATTDEGFRHETACGMLFGCLREAVAGHYPAGLAVNTLRDALGEAGGRLGDEWERMVGWAVGQVQHLDPDETRAALALERYERNAEHLDDGYPPAYIDSIDADAPRDLTIDEIDRLLAEMEPGNVDSDDEQTPDMITFKTLPDPFVVPPLAWLAKGLIVDGTHGELAGPEKVLKSYIANTIDVGLAAGLDILGRWPVDRPRTVLGLIGEGGENAFLRRLGRICAAYGTLPSDIRHRFHYTTQTAPVTSQRFVDGISRALDETQPDLVHLDPWYAYAPANTDSRNLYEIGAALERVGQLVRSGGASLILNNHFNQTGNGTGLRRISMAGHAEWSDSWWLIDHREDPNVDAGRFRLKLDIGSRQWGGGTFHVNYDIGRYDEDLNDHIGAIRWQVFNAGQTADESRDDVKIAEAKRNLVKAWMRRRDSPPHEPWGKREWEDRAPGVSAAFTRTAFEELVDGGRIASVDGTRDKGAKYRLVTAPGEEI